jgi:hypothetical protein
MTSLHWRYQTIPHAAWVARVATGRFEIQLASCSYAFIEHDKIRHAVRWHTARSLKDAQDRCELLYRNADDEASARTVAVQPGQV